MAEHSPGPFMKMSPSGFPGLLIVLFVLFASCVEFGVGFLWVLFGLGFLGCGFAAALRLIGLLKPNNVQITTLAKPVARKLGSQQEYETQSKPKRSRQKIHHQLE